MAPRIHARLRALLAVLLASATFLSAAPARADARTGSEVERHPIVARATRSTESTEQEVRFVRS
jgi:hypothetical protein